MGADKKARATRDRNLLFGVIAVQMRFLQPADLAFAAAQWAIDPNQDLGTVQVTMGLIDVYPWDPKTGKLTEKPLPRPF